MLKQKENSQEGESHVLMAAAPQDAPFRAGQGVVQLRAQFVLLRPAVRVTGSPVIPVQVQHRPCVAQGEVQPQVLEDRRQALEYQSMS